MEGEADTRKGEASEGPGGVRASRDALDAERSRVAELTTSSGPEILSLGTRKKTTKSDLNHPTYVWSHSGP